MRETAAPSLSTSSWKQTGFCLSTLLLLLGLLFVQRAVAAADTSAAQTAPKEARQTSRRKVITNKDLEAFRRKRLAEEADYDRKRAEEGLPSQEELRKRSEERDKRFIELAARIEASRVAEEYERLRGEMSLLRSQLNLLNAQSAATPSGEASSPFFYAYPLILPRGHLSQGFRPGIINHPVHGRIGFPQTFNPFRRGGHGGFPGHRPTGGFSFHLRFGSSPRAPHTGAPRFGAPPPARGASGRR